MQLVESGYKINTQKSLRSLYTNNKKLEREIEETIPFTTERKKKTYEETYQRRQKTYMQKTIRH